MYAFMFLPLPNLPWLELSKLLVQIALAIAAVLVTGFFARRQAEIATSQAKTAAAKLALDLFDRRFELYTDISKGIGSAGSPSDGDPMKLLELYLAAQSWAPRARWLFGIEVATLLDVEIRPTVIEAKEALLDIEMKLSKAPVEDRPKIYEEMKRTIRPKTIVLSGLQGKLDGFLDSYMQVNR